MTTQSEKEQAQDLLMQSMQHAFDKATPAECEVMSKQLERIEKLFGYEKNSWTRGA